MKKKLLLVTCHLSLVTLFAGCSFLEGIRQSNNNDPANSPAATAAPVAVVGEDFRQTAVEILTDYKDYKNGDTGWLYTLEKGLHAYSTVTASVADAKAALKPFIDSKGQPYLDRLMLLLKGKPAVPLATKMAALATLSDHVAADKGP